MFLPSVKEEMAEFPSWGPLSHLNSGRATPTKVSQVGICHQVRLRSSSGLGGPGGGRWPRDESKQSSCLVQVPEQARAELNTQTRGCMGFFQRKKKCSRSSSPQGPFMSHNSSECPSIFKPAGIAFAFHITISPRNCFPEVSLKSLIWVALFWKHHHGIPLNAPQRVKAIVYGCAHTRTHTHTHTHTHTPGVCDDQKKLMTYIKFTSNENF